MFVGTVQPAVRKFLHARASDLRGRKVVVGCSGNFSVETTIAEMGVAAELHSNDVSFYTCMLGRWAVGEPIEFEILDEWAWLREYATTPDDRAGLVVALSGLIRFAKKNVGAYNQRMLSAYREQFPKIHAGTVERCQKVRSQLALTSFYSGDVREHYRRFAEDEQALFLCFAPTYAGGYERLWKPLDSIVRWQEPSYAILDDEGRESIIRWLEARKYVWLDDRDLSEMGLEPRFAVETGRNRTQYLYSNVLTEPGFVAKRSKIKDPAYPICASIREDSVVDVIRVPGDVFAFYRETYLNKGIVPAAPLWCFLVLVDGAVAGAFGMTEPRWGERSGVYMMSDFAIRPVPHARLSKLIVMVAASKTIRDRLERWRLYRTSSVTTTAFTKKPMSMKYRNVLDLVKRGDGFLNYAGEFSDRTAQEQFAEWWRRFAVQSAR